MAGATKPFSFLWGCQTVFVANIPAAMLAFMSVSRLAWSSHQPGSVETA
jgi:hypothetical protein